MSSAVREERQPGDGRARVHEAALRLFADHGVGGTSLQMIADEVGVTKAAVYYHYRTKDELVLGVIAPFIDRIAALVDTAGALRGRRAQLEATVSGLIDIVVDARHVYVVIANDPAVAHLQAGDDRMRGIGEDLVALVTGPDPDPATRIDAIMFLSGMTGPLGEPTLLGVGDDDLRRLMRDTGRRMLLGRRPRARSSARC